MAIQVGAYAQSWVLEINQVSGSEADMLLPTVEAWTGEKRAKNGVTVMRFPDKLGELKGQIQVKRRVRGTGRRRSVHGVIYRISIVVL